MSKKTIIITGSNSGIGKAAVTKFAQLGYKIIMTCRNKARGDQALKKIQSKIPNANIELMIIDLSSQKSIRTFVNEFREKYGQLHMLINNAATFDIWQKKIILTEEGYESVWATNHLGQFLLTNLLLDIMKESAPTKVINIASQGLGAYPFLKLDFEGIERGIPSKFANKENKFSVQWAYYHSKLAQVMFTYELAERLQGTNVTANVIRVGNVRFSEERLTQMKVPKSLQRVYYLKSRLAMTPERMTETYVYCAKDPEMKDVTGQYISHKNKPIRSNRFSYNKEAGKRLWELSKESTMK